MNEVMFWVRIGAGASIEIAGSVMLCNGVASLRQGIGVFIQLRDHRMQFPDAAMAGLCKMITAVGLSIIGLRVLPIEYP